MREDFATGICLHYLHEKKTNAVHRRGSQDVASLRQWIIDEKASGRRFMSASEFNGAEFEHCLTFDDAHYSLRQFAAPLLQSLDTVATVFVPTAYVGMDQEFMSWDDLRFLRDLGWCIGSHTVSHPRMSWRLYDEDEQAYKARLDRECVQSREELEKQLGIEIDCFAYPFGEAPNVAREAANDAGYKKAFIVGKDSTQQDDSKPFDPLRIPRVDGLRVRGSDDVGEDEASITEVTGEPTGFSIIVPTKNRSELVTQCTNRLAQQSYPDSRYEVIVVDDGSSEAIEDVVSSSVRVLRLPKSDRSFRAGQARQYGAKHAAFEILVFLDNDVLVGPDYLWHLDWAHRHTDNAVVLGYLSGYNLHDHGHHHWVSSETLLDELAIIPDRSREPTLRRCLDNLDWLPDPWSLTYTGNLSVSRNLFFQVGGFSDEFVGWGLEDIDFGYGLFEQGASWIFSRFAIGYHISDDEEGKPNNPFRRCRPELRDFDSYRKNLQRLQSRHSSFAIAKFIERAREDIDEICGAPDCVGIEFGGHGAIRGRFYERLHHRQPGGVSYYELLDRVAHAVNIGVRRIFLLGGEPTEHPDFIRLIKAAKDQGIDWIGLQSYGVRFLNDEFCRAVTRAGLDHITLMVGDVVPHPVDLELLIATLRQSFSLSIHLLAEEDESIEESRTQHGFGDLPIDEISRF